MQSFQQCWRRSLVVHHYFHDSWLWHLCTCDMVGQSIGFDCLPGWHCPVCHPNFHFQVGPVPPLVIRLHLIFSRNSANFSYLYDIMKRRKALQQEKVEDLQEKVPRLVYVHRKLSIGVLILTLAD